MIKLQIFIADDCWACEESRRIATDTQARFEDVEVTLLDLLGDEKPANVFAAPTYLLNGQIISLGNPRREDLWAQLAKKTASFHNGGGIR